MSLLLKRKSIRKYTDTLVSKEDIMALLHAGMQAPSAKNQQPWDFIVVDDKTLLKQLSQTSPGAWMLEQAPVAIIPMIRETDKAPHFAQQDLAAVTQNILLEATNLNLGAVWIGIYPLQERVTYVETVLNIKGSTKPFSIIAIGHTEDHEFPKSRFDESRVFWNRWENQ